MLFITKEGSGFDEAIPRDGFFCVVLIVCAIGCLSLIFSPRKVDRKLHHVISETFVVGMISAMYISGNIFILLFYIVEIGLTIYFGIKIENDNRIVDNNKFVIWWKRKKQEKADKEMQHIWNIKNLFGMDTQKVFMLIFLIMTDYL